MLGPFNLDLFASRTNAQLPDYYSWKPDPYVKTVDAFTVSWSQDQPYLFPPFNLIGRALTYKDSNRFSEVCLPYSSSLASASLVSASTADAGQMPSSPTNGRGPTSEPGSEPSSFSVRGTDVSSRMAHLRQTYAMQGFQSRLQNYSYNPGEQIHTRLTTQPGLSGVAGVIGDKFIPFQHL